MELKRNVFDSRPQEYFVCVLLASFCAMKYINDVLYLEGERRKTKGRRVGAKNPSVQCRDSRKLSTKNLKAQMTTAGCSLKPHD